VRAKGIVCNHKRVERLMRVNAIQGVSRRRKRPMTTDSKHKLPLAPNVLNREFTASAPNQK
jgi:putative transposase